MGARHAWFVLQHGVGNEGSRNENVKSGTVLVTKTQPKMIPNCEKNRNFDLTSPLPFTINSFFHPVYQLPCQKIQLDQLGLLELVRPR